MSLRHHLQLDAGSELRTRLTEAWPRWQETDSRLLAVNRFEGLRGWLEVVDGRTSNGLMHALAWLGARDGGDDPDAVAALAWCLLPGANRIARDLWDLSDDIEALVSGQLWLEIQTFAWQRRSTVASNVLMDTRAAVLRECGILQPAHLRRDRTWAATRLADPQVLYTERGKTRARTAGPRFLTASGRAAPTARDELVEFSGWASSAGIITAADRLLLLRVLDEATDNPPPRRRDTYGGMTSPMLATRVAARSGLSGRQVERRTARTVKALMAVAHRYAEEYGGSSADDGTADHPGVEVSVDTWLWPARTPVRPTAA